MTRKSIPRNPENDYSTESAATRRAFIQEQTGTALNHVGQFSAAPESMSGNCENFVGITQIPPGIADPF